MTGLIAGRYRLLDEAGRGAMGVVWRARDEQLDRVVAVKQLASDTADATSSARAMREARVAARLRHPHAITVHDVVDHDGRPYLVMEYVPSRSLAAILGEQGVLPAERVAGIGADLASALAAAHEAGIVHRDVTPANILITPAGDAKIADFGISRVDGESLITGGGVIAGTPAYLAPEVAAGGESGFPADVFSLGATLYHALEGAPPFGTDENPYAVLARVANDPVIPPRRSGALADVLVRLLQRDAARRPTMPQAQALLTAVVQGRPLPPATRLLRVRPSRRRPAIAATVGAVLLVLGVVIGIAIAPHGGPAASPAGHRVSTPTGASTAQAAPADVGCLARYQVTTSWPNGYQVQVTVHNTRTAGLAGWRVTWRLPDGEHIAGLWNGLWDMRGSVVTVDNANWNAHLGAAATTTFGLNVTTPGPAGAQSPTLSCQGIAE